MKHVLIVLAVICALTSLGRTQLGPPPPPGYGWVLQSTTMSGRTYGHHYEYVMGVPMEVPFDYNWNEGIDVWARNLTGLPHDVEITTEGKFTFKFVWMGTGPAPSRVLVQRTSTAAAGWTTQGSGEADNGLGIPAVLQGNLLSSSGMRKKVYSGSGGEFEVEIEIRAHATGSQEATAERGASATILNRAVYIKAVNQEANYRKKLTGETVYSHGGSYPKAVPELVLPEENSSGQLYHIVQLGLTLVTRAYYDYNGPYTHIDARAWTVGDHEPTETFQWSTPLDNTSGTLPGLFGDYSFGDAGVTNFFWPCKEFDNDVTNNGAGTYADAAITYTWNDGYSMTSKMRVIARNLRENHEIFKSIDYTEDGQLTWNFASFRTLSSDPEWTSVNSVSLECILLKKDADLYAAAQIGAIVIGAGAEFIPYWPARLLCIAAGVGLSQLPVEDETGWFYESTQKFQDAIARTPEHGPWIDVKPGVPLTESNIEEVMREYAWQVKVLPLYQTDWYVVDMFGPNGYEGQEEDHVTWQKSFRLGYAFRVRSGTGVGG